MCGVCVCVQREWNTLRLINKSHHSFNLKYTPYLAWRRKTVLYFTFSLSLSLSQTPSCWAKPEVTSILSVESLSVGLVTEVTWAMSCVTLIASLKSFIQVLYQEDTRNIGKIAQCIFVLSGLWWLVEVFLASLSLSLSHTHTIPLFLFRKASKRLHTRRSVLWWVLFYQLEREIQIAFIFCWYEKERLSMVRLYHNRANGGKRHNLTFFSCG